MFANLTDRSWSLLFLFYYTTETHFIEQFRVYGLFLDCPAEVTLRTGSTLSLAFQIIQWAVLISVEGNGRVSGSVVLVLVVLVSCFSQTRGEWRVESGDCSSQTYYCFLCCRSELSLSPSLYLFLSNFSPLGARVPPSISHSFSASHLPPLEYYSLIRILHRDKAGRVFIIIHWTAVASTGQ